MKTVTYNTQKRAIALSLSAVYLLMCIVIIFVMPNSHDSGDKHKIGYAKISNTGFKGIKNVLKRTDKIKLPDRKYIAEIFPFIFTLVYGYGSIPETYARGLCATVNTHRTAPIQFGCMLNCCRLI